MQTQPTLWNQEMATGREQTLPPNPSASAVVSYQQLTNLPDESIFLRSSDIAGGNYTASTFFNRGNIPLAASTSRNDNAAVNTGTETPTRQTSIPPDPSTSTHPGSVVPHGQHQNALQQRPIFAQIRKIVVLLMWSRLRGKICEM